MWKPWGDNATLGGGLLVLLEMPIVGGLTGKYPAKYIIASGWLALGMFVVGVKGRVRRTNADCARHECIVKARCAPVFYVPRTQRRQWLWDDFGFFRLLYTALTNISVVQGPELAP